MSRGRQSSPQGRRTAASRHAAATLVLVLVVAAAPTAAHAVNYTSIDPQYTADGTVVVEAVYLEETGWIALYADGDPVGHARVDSALTTVTDVRVPITSWPENGVLEVRPRLYAGDGDGEFNPSTDRELVLFGTQAATVVARGDADAHVLAEQAGPLELVDGTVSVRSVALPANGTVLVETTDGTRLGSRSLRAGTHTNVSVPLNRTALPETGATSIAIALLVDGDAVQAGGEPVRSVVELSVDEPATDTAAAVVTPSLTSSTAPPNSRTDTEQPGFSIVVLVAGLVACALVCRSR